MISTTTGVFTFLLFLLLAVQVAYNLYATTMVTSAAHDAARRIAGADMRDDPNAQVVAERWVRELLGSYGREHVRNVTLRTDRQQVVLRIEADNPSLLPPVIRRPIGLDSIDRTVRVRIEDEVAE